MRWLKYWVLFSSLINKSKWLLSFMKPKQLHFSSTNAYKQTHVPFGAAEGKWKCIVGGLCCRGGWNKRKQTASFFSERLKKESENISGSAELMWFLCRARRISACCYTWMCGSVFIWEAVGGGLTGEVTPSQRSFEWKCVKFHRRAKMPARFLDVHQ